MILDVLKKNNVVSKQHAKATPLTGGVSCEIYLIEDQETRFVAKRALAQLKVEQEWFANTDRNVFEQRYLSYVGEHFPQYVPKLLASLEKEQLFTMEYLPEEFKDWKKRLLAGEITSENANKHASLMGKALAEIHSISWGDNEVSAQFESDDNFKQLRLEPYFESLIAVHPDRAAEIQSLINQIKETKQCLVHGDYSPKNILVSENEIKIVDCEVAWYGDACFDVAFMLHHLLLKAIHFNNSTFSELGKSFLDTYLATLPAEQRSCLSLSHLTRLTLYLMLARLDGKSPVEYLDQEERNQIRHKVIGYLNSNLSDPYALILGVLKSEN